MPRLELYYQAEDENRKVISVRVLSIGGGESIDPERVIQSSAHSDNNIFRRDRYIGLPLFLITLVWLWIRMVEEPGKLKSAQAET